MSRSSPVGWNELRALPSRLWMRWAPAVWPESPSLAIDLTRAGLFAAESPAAQSPGTLPEAPPEPPEVVYLAPVSPADDAGRFALATQALASGCAVLWQRLPDGPRPPAGALDVVDLLPALLTGVWPSVDELNGAQVALWPLVGGTSAEFADEREQGLAVLVAARVPALLGVPLELDPGERRRLVDQGGAAWFDRLFHGDPPSARELARDADRRGLRWGIPRPKVLLSPVAERNRALAGRLGQAAELWTELGRSESAGAELWRAARQAESFHRDLAALAREGNLGLLPWLTGPAREIVEEWAAAGDSRALARLEREWSGGGEG